MKSILKGTITLLLILVSTVAFGQEFKTPLKVSKGQECVYQSDMIMNMTMTQAGQEINLNNTSKTTTKYKIENVLSSGNIELLTSVWDVSSRSQVMGKDTTITFNGKVSPTYKINIDKYGNTVSKVMVDSTSVKELSELSAGNKIINSGMFCEFPEKNLKVGEKWNKTTTDTISNMGMKLGYAVKMEYTLGALETINGKSLQKIIFKSEIEIGGKGNMQGMDMFVEGNGVGNGNMYIDPVSKIVNESKLDMETEMTMAISGAQSMTIPMNQKMSVTQKLKQ